MSRLLFPLLIGLAGTLILLWLGLWQLDRLAWKEGILAEIETQIGADPVPLPAYSDPEADKYLAVTVSGQFGEGLLRVLVSQKQVGPGYLIVSPFRTDDGRTILIDRGFLRLETPPTPPPAGSVTLTGNLHWPDDRTSSTPENDVAENIWFARDIPQMAEILQTEPVLIVAREIPGSLAVAPLPVTIENIPNDHLQYAVTWFSLAAIWVVMTGYYIFRNRKRPEGAET
ncbi:MAG: SURF1 family protein [Pseudomonadota bacterium]